MTEEQKQKKKIREKKKNPFLDSYPTEKKQKKKNQRKGDAPSDKRRVRRWG